MASKNHMYSNFGQKMTAKSGINELMDDLGNAMKSNEILAMLGGGNPARIPEVERQIRKRMEHLLQSSDEFEKMVGIYDPPQGNVDFLKALAEILKKTYGWNLTHKNITLTNGSQNSFFYLFNLFGGQDQQNKMGKILFPMVPEYIGYVDQGIESGSFYAQKPLIKKNGTHDFKYFIDFDNLKIQTGTKAICVSRPTNPTGNVLTDLEVEHLSKIAKEKDIFLFIDHAYGAPFPNIIFDDVKLEWHDHMVLSMSLSKVGMPATRTGIIVAREDLIADISRMNAIVGLSTNSIGAHLALDFVRSGEIIEMSQKVIRPFYQKRAQQAQKWIEASMDQDLPYFVHCCEGSMFLWLWFEGLPISSSELYQILKEKSVIVVPGHYFFPGFEKEWQHRHECIRINYALNPKDVERGINIIAETIKQIYRKN